MANDQVTIRCNNTTVQVHEGRHDGTVVVEITGTDRVRVMADGERVYVKDPA